MSRLLVPALAAGLAACGPSGGTPSAAVLAIRPVDVRAPSGESAPLAPERCPSDAPWNGRVCLGGGYVACPGDARFDDGGACQRSPLDSRDAGGRRDAD
jgi:hypothetical protein